MLVDGDWIEADVRPTAAPPPLREENFEARPGFVFVRGRWDWRNGNWAWIDGHWEKERPGKRWREARWEMRDGAYLLVDGDWDEAPMYPTAAPPPSARGALDAQARLRLGKRSLGLAERRLDWVAGHCERERARQRWNEGRWELHGDH